MAVVTIAGSAFPDETVPIAFKEAVIAEGKLLSMVSRATITSGNSADSVINFGKIPLNARINSLSSLLHPAITGLSDFDLGVTEDPDCLIDGANLTSGTSKAFAAQTIAELNNPVWQLAGLSAEKIGMTNLIGTLNADAGATGVVAVNLLYTVPGR